MTRHRFHSICPYFAMFPESFAEHWISRLTRKNDLVLDMFSGRGTTAFQAILMGRNAIAIDINDVAYCLTRAKTNAPSRADALRRLRQLERSFDPEMYSAAAASLGEFFECCFEPNVLNQILHLRCCLRWKERDDDSMLAAVAMGALHGESSKSPYYFSAQMPRTISTKPAYSLRYWKTNKLQAPVVNVFEILRNRIQFRYASRRPRRRATVLHSDMRILPSLLPPGQLVDAIISSPPYLDVTSFEEDQWLRLWFLGRANVPTYGQLSRDDRHTTGSRYWGFIADMWETVGQVIKPNGSVVLRLGARGSTPEELACQLEAAAKGIDRSVSLIEWSSSEIVRRQTKAFTPRTSGCKLEVDCLFRVD